MKWAEETSYTGKKEGPLELGSEEGNGEVPGGKGEEGGGGEVEECAWEEERTLLDV